MEFIFAGIVFIIITKVVCSQNNINKEEDKDVFDSELKHSPITYLKLFFYNSKRKKISKRKNKSLTSKKEILSVEDFAELEIMETVKPFCRYENDKELTIIANKNCVIKYSYPHLYSHYILGRDKKTGEGFKLSFIASGSELFPSKALREFWLNEICENFNYETTYNEINVVAKNIFKRKQGYYNYPANTADKDIFQININNASVAEYTTIPGINIGKANKIAKYIKEGGKFAPFISFLDYIEPTEENKKLILEMYNQGKLTI